MHLYPTIEVPSHPYGDLTPGDEHSRAILLTAVGGGPLATRAVNDLAMSSSFVDGDAATKTLSGNCLERVGHPRRAVMSLGVRNKFRDAGVHEQGDQWRQDPGSAITAPNRPSWKFLQLPLSCRRISNACAARRSKLFTYSVARP